MRLRIFTEPQEGASYDTLLRVAKATEELGFDAFFRSDHYRAIFGAGLPGPTDSWITLGALARETGRIRLGTLVSSATFRLPGPLALSVAQVDQMSGGRVELGLGAGWYEAEHSAYGIPFPGIRERFDRLEEQLAVITGLWQTPDGETYSFDGSYYQVADSPALPKPAQRPHPPIIVGGWGTKRTPRLAARFAAEFNAGFQAVAATGEAIERARAACAEAGSGGGMDTASGGVISTARRAEMAYSAAQPVCCGRDEAEVKRRADAIGQPVEGLRDNGIAGSPAEVVDKIGRYGEVGCDRIYLQVLDLHDLDHLELLASDVLPQV